MKPLLLITLKLIAIPLTTTFSFSVYADGDEEGIFKRWYENKNAGISAVKLEQYNDLCGSCHFPYQPGLMPGMSWERIMTDLDSHFGRPVTMKPVETRTMMRYLLDNSAGHVNDDISNQILQSLKYTPVPVRITTTPFFVNKHNQLKNKVKQQNMGQCDRCHQDAQQGLYEKKKLRSPNKKLM